MNKALIYFTKEPLEGKVKTRLAKSIGDTEATKIYKLMLNQILGLHVRDEIDKFVFTQTYSSDYKKYFEGSEIFIQVGDNIGEKMLNAFITLFAKGYEQVILIGADIPLLDEEIIHDAFDALKDHHATINKSEDGGYYLIGFNKEYFKQKSFQIDFSDVVFNRTLDTLKSLHVKIGKELFDIDYIADLRRFASLNLQTKLGLHVKKLLSSYPSISVIIPVYFEKENLPKTLQNLKTNAKELNYEIIISDTPDVTTIEDIDTTSCFTCKALKAGRAYQLNEGAKMARGEILLFLHADTFLPKNWDEKIYNLYTQNKNLVGAFSLGINTNKLFIKLIEFLANVRVYFTNTPYGDQGQFFSSNLFNEINGYDEIPLMEDISIIKKIHQKNIKVKILKTKIYTSDRRWKNEGMLYTSLRNRILSTLYYFGVSAEKLKRYYKF